MRTCLFVMVFTMISIKGSCQQTGNVYYLCIGSGHYDFSKINAGKEMFEDNEQLPEAIKSSRIMEEIIREYGKGKGIMLNSGKKKLLSKNDMLSGLEQLWKMMEKDKTPAPLVIVYYAGHGFVDSLVGSQFLLSGNYPGTYKKDDFDERVKHNMYLLELVFLLMFKQPAMTFREMDKIFDPATDLGTAMDLAMKVMMNLASPPVRSVVLLDCCRNPLTDDGLNVAKLQLRYSSTDISALNSGFMQLVQIIKPIYENALSQMQPVIFSGRNMAAVPTVPYPANRLVKRQPLISEGDIGPICRETILLLDNKLEHGKVPINLADWLKLLIAHPDKSQYSISTLFDLDTLDLYPLFEF